MKPTSETPTNSKSSEGSGEYSLLIDGRSIFDRGWHASRTSEELAHLDSARAAACSCLMVLLPILSSTHLDERYRKALFAWDSGFHKTVKPRKPKPEGFQADFEYFKGIVATLAGGAHCTAPDAEADDVVATAACRLTEQQVRSCVVSGDKDLQQLVNRYVGYYCLNRKSMLSATHIMERWNLFHPSHLAVWLAVVGDLHDGVHGVEKWGEKKWAPKIMATAPKDCDLGTLVEHVLTVIPEKQHGNFMTSLEATLLNTSVADVPAPDIISPVALDFIDDEGLGPIRTNYARFIGELNAIEPASAASPADRED